jgi:hypothetical protein
MVKQQVCVKLTRVLNLVSVGREAVPPLMHVFSRRGVYEAKKKYYVYVRNNAGYKNMKGLWLSLVFRMGWWVVNVNMCMCLRLKCLSRCSILARNETALQFLVKLYYLIFYVNPFSLIWVDICIKTDRRKKGSLLLALRSNENGLQICTVAAFTSVLLLILRINRNFNP